MKSSHSLLSPEFRPSRITLRSRTVALMASFAVGKVLPMLQSGPGSGFNGTSPLRTPGRGDGRKCYQAWTRAIGTALELFGISVFPEGASILAFMSFSSSRRSILEIDVPCAGSVNLRANTYGLIPSRYHQYGDTDIYKPCPCLYPDGDYPENGSQHRVRLLP